ncbi:MAG TPA: tetratricopeptide repeat protein [Bacteroidia bacterium]|nr:tetratricopeptide repeat protein [Bacteroidia bacterium]
MKLIKSIIVLAVLSLAISCSSKGKPEDKKTEKHDSLADKINSPELKALNDLILKNPGDAELYNKRAKLYIKLKQLDVAIGDALRATKLDTSKAAYYVTLADVYFASNKTRYAKETLEATVKHFPDNSEALLKLGELYFLVRQYENAITYINKALKIDENIAEAYYLKGSVFKEMGDTAKAISSMQTAIEQDTKFFDAFLDIGILYASRKNPLAFEYYANALKLRPNDNNVLYAKAKLLQDLNKIDESIALYQQILKADKDNANVLYNLGAISLDKKKDPNTAIDYFSKAIAADPKYTEAYFARGVCFEQLKDIDNARADYNMCLKITPNYEPALDALNKK